MTEEEIKAEIQRMLDAGAPREQIDEFVRNAKKDLVAKTDEPKKQAFEYVGDQKQTQPNQVVEQGGYEYKFEVGENDKLKYYTKEKDTEEWSLVDPKLSEENFVTNPAYVSIGQEFGHFKKDDFDREAYFKQEEEDKKPMTEYEIREKVIDALPGKYKIAGLVSQGANIIKDLITKPEEREQTLEVAKNAISNVKPRLLATGLKIAAGAADLVTADLDGLGYNEKQRKIRDEAEVFMKEKYKEIQAVEKYLIKDTGEGIVKGIKQGDASDFIGGIINANTSMVETVVPAMLTGGISLPFQVIAPMYSDYNEAKAKAIYGKDDPNAMDKLIDNDQTELAVPAALGLLATSLEYVGFKGITKAIFSNPGAKTFGAKLLLTGNKEGLTEWGQSGIEAANTAFAEGKNVAEAGIALRDNMFSEAGVESYLNGFVGASGMTTAGSAVNRALRSDNASIKDINDKINNLADLNYKKNKTKNQDVKDAINLEIKEKEQDLRDYINEKRKLNKVLTAEEKTSLVNVLNEKNGIKEKVESLKAQLQDKKITNKEFGYAVRSLNNQDKKLSDQLGEIQAVATTRAADAVTETVKEQIKKAGLEGKVTEMTSEDISNIKDEGFDSKTAAKEFGFIKQFTDGSFEIILNKDKPMVGTAAHEFMHAVLFKTIGANKNIQDTLGDALVEHTSDLGGETSVLGERLSAYGEFQEDGTFVRADNFGEETITIMSESIIDGSLKFNENFFTKIGDIVRRFSQNYLGKEITFDTGRDVYNFVKDYSKSIKDGKINKAILKVAKEGAKGKLVEGKAKPEATVQMSKDASDNVQRIYEEQGEAGAMDIIEAFKPITSKIVERRSEAPNFDRQLLTDEIETGQRGIFDLIREYKPESGVPLAAYINKFLPARAIEASQRVLGEEFTDDISERVDIATEEVAEPTVTAKPKPKKIVLAERLGVTDKAAKAVKKILPDLNVSDLNIKTLKNKVPNITGELFGISPKKIKSGANITKSELQSAQMFINKNADLLIAMLPEGATPGGTATGVPKVLLNEFYTKTDRAKMAKTGTKAGLAIQQKNKINKADFLEVFGIIEGKPVRTDRNTSARVLALANQLGKMVTNQTVRQELAKKPDAKKDITRIAEGKSDVLFSKSVDKIINIRSLFELETKGIDKLLKTYEIDKTFNLRTEQGREDFVKAIEETLLPLMPRDFWFGADSTIFTASNKAYGLSMSKPKEAKIYNDIRDRIKALKKLPDSKFGKPIKGVDNYSVSAYSTIFKDNATIKNNLKNGKIKDWNKKVGLIHKEMWKRFNKAISDNPENAKAIGSYLKLVGSDTSHWHKLGAQFVGYSDKITGKRFEYEHAMPATAAYLYLIDAALSDSNFDASYNAVIDNYKLIALDKAMDKKLTSVGLQRRMPEGWDLMQDNWYDRYFNDTVNSVDGGIDPNSIIAIDGKTFGEAFSIKKPITKENISKTKKLDEAIKYSRSTKNESKGITVLDFDDTLATTKSLVKYTTPDGKTGTLNAEEFASTYEDLQDQGYTFDFSDFNKVVKGKLAPLFNKAIKLQGKFGPKNMFVLTARPPQAAKAIFDFLKANGLNIPLKNITGLGNSTAEAKALWIADKVGDGYNDFYFADDALQNVQAVKNMLDQFDVKSKVQQAKVKFSKDMNTNFNNILEEVTGIESEKRFSDIKARKRGESKGKFRVFIPPSHEDFVGLLYNFMGKGREGNQHRDFFEQALVKPLNRAYREIDTARQAIANDYKSLNKQFPDVKNKLTKKTPDGDFTFQDAIRIYLWNKHGHKVPGLSPTDQAGLSELVMNDNELRSYAETLNVISKQETYVNPTEGWEGGNIRIDLMDATGRVGRAQYLTEFNENAEVLFSEENLNKIEAAYGASFRSALEDMLHRIKTGVNRPKGQSGAVNKFINYLNGSVGSVMFFNTRSAILQQMSNVNYLNFADNNIFTAAKAFANQPQYWKDFAFIFNSDMLKQRRGGIGTDINGAELAEAVSRSTNPIGSVIGKLLQLGFLPTQIGDNIAIATGGAAFYRNRINKYIKDGLSKKEAEKAAFTDFQNITQSTQQSARPDMTSQQQASWIGKLVLNFLNTPSQYNRIIKKAGSDILNRRITPPNTTQTQSDMSNASRILYYGAAQNLIFYSLQTALFALMFGTDDEDEDKKAEQFLKKKERVINGAIDTILRGSGIYGVAVSTLKNMMVKFLEQREKGYNKDESAVIMEMLNFSPVIGIKARKVVNAEKTLNYNKNIIEEMNTFDIDNPQWSAVTNYVEATTNAPVNRLYQKSINLRNAMDNKYTTFQRALFFSGYTTWSLNLGDTEKMKEIKETVKEKKKAKSKEKSKKKREEKKKEKIKKMTPTEKLFDLTKKQQVDSLSKLGFTKKEIRGLNYEKDRVNKILETKGIPRKKKKNTIDWTLE